MWHIKSPNWYGTLHYPYCTTMLPHIPSLPHLHPENIYPAPPLYSNKTGEEGYQQSISHIKNELKPSIAKHKFNLEKLEKI